MNRFVFWIVKRQLCKKGKLYKSIKDLLIIEQMKVFDNYGINGRKKAFNINDIRTITDKAAENFLERFINAPK